MLDADNRRLPSSVSRRVRDTRPATASSILRVLYIYIFILFIFFPSFRFFSFVYGPRPAVAGVLSDLFSSTGRRETFHRAPTLIGPEISIVSVNFRRFSFYFTAN